MSCFFKTVLVAASLTTAGLATTATPASAGSGSFSITIGSGGYGDQWGGPRRDRDYREDSHRDRDYRDDSRRNRAHWDGSRRNRDFCSPYQALEKARWMGIRHAHVVEANHRVVKVVGRDRGYRVKAVFANTWDCPVIRYH